MQKWEYVTVPLLSHATKQILDNWGDQGYELVIGRARPDRRAAGRLPEAAHRSEVTTTPSERLAELGLTLPPVTAPLAAYVPAVAHGGLVWSSGQLPMVDGKLAATGLVGAESTAAGDRRPRGGAELARICALNAFAAVASVAGPGGIDAIARIVKVVGFVASAAGLHRPARRRRRGEQAAGRGLRRGRPQRPQRGRSRRAAARRTGRGRADRRARRRKCLRSRLSCAS